MTQVNKYVTDPTKMHVFNMRLDISVDNHHVAVDYMQVHADFSYACCWCCAVGVVLVRSSAGCACDVGFLVVTISFADYPCSVDDVVVVESFADDTCGEGHVIHQVIEFVAMQTCFLYVQAHAFLECDLDLSVSNSVVCRDHLSNRSTEKYLTMSNRQLVEAVRILLFQEVKLVL